MARLSDEQARLFLESNIGVVATIRKDGTPQLTPVWVDWDGEYVLFNTAEGRTKPRNIRRDPRVAVTVVDGENPYHFVTVDGTAEIVEDRGRGHVNSLSRRYRGADFPDRPGERRLIVKVRPVRVHEDDRRPALDPEPGTS
jgi:PPOX class probable F420-dependent enzyme